MRNLVVNVNFELPPTTREPLGLTVRFLMGTIGGCFVNAKIVQGVWVVNSSPLDVLYTSFIGEKTPSP